MIYTPGHTPACVSYRIEDAVFVGDTLFMPDYGTARADFPGGDARTLYRSMQRAARAAAARRGSSCATTTRRRAAITTPGRPRSREERARNVHVHDGVSEDEFVALREARDAHARRAAAADAVDPDEHPRRASSRRPRRTACAT